MSSHIEEYIIKAVQPMLQLITYSRKKLIHMLYMSVVDSLKYQTHFYKFILSW